MGGCGCSDHRFCCQLFLRLCLRGRMRRRAIFSPLALISTSLMSVSFLVLPLLLPPSSVLLQAGTSVVLIFSPTTIPTPPPSCKKRIGGQTIPPARKETTMLEDLTPPPPTPPPPISALPLLLLPFLSQQIWRKRENNMRRRSDGNEDEGKYDSSGCSVLYWGRGLFLCCRFLLPCPPPSLFPRFRLKLSIGLTSAMKMMGGSYPSPSHPPLSILLGGGGRLSPRLSSLSFVVIIFV